MSATTHCMLMTSDCLAHQVRPIVALEWVADLAILRPPTISPDLAILRPSTTSSINPRAAFDARRPERRPAVAAELARGVSADMLMRSHAFGPNKQASATDDRHSLPLLATP